MAVKTLKCPNCAASVTSTPDEAIVTCPYCTTTFSLDLASSADGARVAAGAASAGGLLLGCGALIVVLTVAGVVTGVATTRRPPAPSTPIVIDVDGISGIVSKEAVTPAHLAEATGRLGWFPLDAPGMVGEAERFDVVGNQAWMQGIVQAWSTDAQLTYLRVSEVRADGTVDVSARGKGKVDARYTSPTMRATQKAMIEVTTGSMKTELRLQLEEGKVEAMFWEATDVDEELGAPFVPTCTLPALMKVWSEHDLPPRPTYQVLWQHVGDYWRVGIDAEKRFDREAEVPFLDPTTCAPR